MDPVEEMTSWLMKSPEGWELRQSGAVSPLAADPNDERRSAFVRYKSETSARSPITQERSLKDFDCSSIVAGGTSARSVITQEQSSKDFDCSSIVTGGSSSKDDLKEDKHRITVKVRGDLPEDGRTWLKYGEKLIKGSRYPRSYFKCADCYQYGCSVLKTVQACDEGGPAWLMTYIGRHTCGLNENADQDLPLSNKRAKTMLSSASIQGNIKDWGEVVDQSGQPSSETSFLTSAVHVSLDEFDLNRPKKVDTSPLQETELPNESVCMSPIEPLESPHRLHLLLALQNTCLGQSVFVGVVVHTSPSQTLEFYFFDAKHMALCVGVGLPRAKVILHSDLSVTVEETIVSERELKETWKSFVDKSSSHLVMKVKAEVPGLQGDRHDHTHTSALDKGETLSQLFGVGFDGGSLFVDETYDAAEVSWPLLYDMALFLLTRNDVQCHETSGESSAQGSGSLQGNSQDNNMVQELHRKCSSLDNRGNSRGGGDGDEDGLGWNDSMPDDDDPPVVLKVTVYPLTKCDILDIHVKPYGLDGASIAQKLVFEFRRNHECKRISIKTQTRLEVASDIDVFLSNTNVFGWYHNGIQIFFGCEDRLESGRAALLKQGSSKILNPRSFYKYTTTKSKMSSKANTYTAGTQAGFSSLLGAISMQGSLSTSEKQQEDRSNSENIEVARECICGGFSFRDDSRTEFPARANFFLSYPIEKFSVWGDREFLQGEGLFATIEPSIEGTWIPLNGLDASPYLFKAVRSLKFHARFEGVQGDMVLDYKQEYVLPFYVNHAMSHLRSQRSKSIELVGNQQGVPNVLMVGSVY